MAKGGLGKANQANRTKRSVGAYGSKRGKPDIQVARRRNREQSGRWQAAREETEAARQHLEQLVADGVSPTQNPVLTPQQALDAQFTDLCVCGHPESAHMDTNYRRLKCKDCTLLCTSFTAQEPEPEPEPAPIATLLPFGDNKIERVFRTPDPVVPKSDIDPDAQCDEVPLWYAVRLTQQGYHVNAVSRRTGWGVNFFKHHADADGWGIIPESDEDKEDEDDD